MLSIIKLITNLSITGLKKIFKVVFILFVENKKPGEAGFYERHGC